MIVGWFEAIFFPVGLACIGFAIGCGFGYSSGCKTKFEEEKWCLKRDAEYELKLKVIVDHMFGGDEKWKSRTKTKTTAAS